MYISQLIYIYIYIFFLLSHTLSLSLMAKKKKKSPYFSLLSHTLSLCLFKSGNTLFFPPWLFSWRWQHFALSFLAIFLKVATLWSLSPPWLSSRRRQHFTLSSLCYLPSENPFYFSLSLFVLRSIFPLPIKRTLGPNPSNSL